MSNVNKLVAFDKLNGILVISGFDPICNCVMSYIGNASSVYGNVCTWEPAQLKKYSDVLFLKNSEWIIGVFVLSMIQNDIFLKLFQFVLLVSTPWHSSIWYQNTLDCDAETGIYFNFGAWRTNRISNVVVQLNKFSSRRSNVGDVLTTKLTSLLKHLKFSGNAVVWSKCYKDIHTAESFENSANH